ncbi:MAG: acyl-CoA dehydrogenase family protein [Polyangiales bacterium]
MHALAPLLDAPRFDREGAIFPRPSPAPGERRLRDQDPQEQRRQRASRSRGRRGCCRSLGRPRQRVEQTVPAHGLLAANAVGLFGNDLAARPVAPGHGPRRVARGLALTERTAYSDPGAIRTQASAPAACGPSTARRSWVTNGGLADLAVVVARTTDARLHARPKPLRLRVERADGFTTSPSPREAGFAARRRPPCASRASGHQRAPPGRRLLGLPGGDGGVLAGQGGLAAACAGAARRLVSLCIERVNARAAFGRNIAEFGMVKEKLAGMMAETWAMESTLYLTTGIADAKVPDWSLESAMSKLFASEALGRVANAAVDLAGGVGIAQGEPWERTLRDARVFQIMQGTNETLRAYVALGGLQGPSRQIAEVSRAMREPIKGFGLMYEFAIQRARTALGRERMARCHRALRREAAVVEEGVLGIARAVDKVLRRHGKDIAEMQFSQRRLADVITDLYALTACLARCTRLIERKGESGAQREADLTAAFANQVERRLRANLAAFEENDDRLLAGIAARACADGAYSFKLP